MLRRNLAAHVPGASFNPFAGPPFGPKRGGLVVERTPFGAPSGCLIDVPVQCSNCEVRHLTLCAAVDNGEMQRLVEILKVIDVPAGGSITEEAEPADHVFNVTGGAVRLYKLLADGRRAVTGFLFPGDFLGLTGGEAYACSAEAMTPVRLCRFPRRKLEGLFSALPKLERRLLAIASNELAAAQDQMVLLGRKTAAEKLASFLLQLSRRQEARNQASEPVSLPMGRTDIADYLGLTTETVSRTITQFKTTGLISLQPRGRVALCDRQALEDCAEGS